jgi:hypothetical protein
VIDLEIGFDIHAVSLTGVIVVRSDSSDTDPIINGWLGLLFAVSIWKKEFEATVGHTAVPALAPKKNHG